MPSLICWLQAIGVIAVFGMFMYCYFKYLDAMGNYWLVKKDNPFMFVTCTFGPFILAITWALAMAFCNAK